MNIFILDEDIDKCAEAHVDRHVIKMILESAQMLCTAHWINKYVGDIPKLESDEWNKLKNKSKTSLGFSLSSYYAQSPL